MSIIKTPYSPARINHIRQLLVNSKEAGKAIDYEIRVDDLRVIPRTCDPELFDGHEDFVTSDTRTIAVLLYEGSSRNNTRYVLQYGEEPKAQIVQPEERGLSGIELEKTINEKLQQERKDWQQQLLEKENAELKAEIKEAETYIDTLEEKLQAARNGVLENKEASTTRWGSIASIALEELLKRNSHLIAMIPGGKGLAGILSGEEAEEEPEEAEAEVRQTATFSKKKASDPETPLSTEQKEIKLFLQIMEDHFDREMLLELMGLIGVLAQSPEAIPAAQQAVSDWIQENPDEEESEVTLSDAA